MHKIVFILLLILGVGKLAAGDKIVFSPADRKLAEAYLHISGVPQNIEKTLQFMLEAQKKSFPDFARYRPVLEKYYRKIYSFPALKDELITCHLQLYSPAELRALIAFYRTPVGQKKAQNDGQVSIIMAQIAARRTALVLKDLQRELQDVSSSR